MVFLGISVGAVLGAVAVASVAALLLFILSVLVWERLAEGFDGGLSEILVLLSVVPYMCFAVWCTLFIFTAVYRFIAAF